MSRRRDDEPNKGGKVIELRQGGKRELSADELEQAKAERSPAHAPRNTPLCGARLTEDGAPTGETCSQTRGWGTPHPGYGRCKKHGGNTKTGKAAAASQMAQEYARQQREQMALFGRRVVITPEEAMLGELGRTQAIVQSIETLMAEWRSADWSDTERANSAHEDAEPFEDGEDNGVTKYGQTATGLPQLVAVHTTSRAVGFTDTEWAAWMKHFLAERKHLVAVAQACLAGNIAERRQRILEANGLMLRKVVEATLGALGMDSADPRIPALVQAAIVEVVQELAG